MMSNADRQAPYKNSHNIFVDVDSITQPDASFRITYIDNANEQFFDELIKHGGLESNPMNFFKNDPTFGKSSGTDEEKKMWFGGVGGLKHNCQLPTSLANVLRTVPTGAAYVARLLALMGPDVKKMDTVFDGYSDFTCRCNEKKLNCPQAVKTAVLLEGFAGRYDVIRKEIPPSCYESGPNRRI